MPFLQRNLYYLRASPRAVLQTFLYIDPTNLRWMNAGLHVQGDEGDVDLTEEDEWEAMNGETSNNKETTGDRIWAYALAHLRDRIMPKLRKEAAEGGLLASSSSNAKGAVDVHVDVDFQMAYFFRTTSGRHAVLLKDKQLIFPTRKMQQMPPPLVSASTLRKEEGMRADLPPSRLAERQIMTQNESHVLAEGGAIDEGDDEEAEAQHDIQRKRRRPSTGVRVKDEVDQNADLIDVDVDENLVDNPNVAAETDAIDVDELEDDKKPRMQVSYSGFQIFGKSLIVVIEPTKRARRSRPALFLHVKPTEKQQLSATPIPDEERRTSLPGAANASRSPSRADSRAQSARLFRSRRGDSLSSDLDADENERDRVERADSRRTSVRQSVGLFRGTPSEWEPTPSPAPRLRPQRSQLEQQGGNEDVDVDGEDVHGSQSVVLATQMLETDFARTRTNDLDDD